ncbi:MAG: hypothetical protein IT431_09700 [Phycisphaerales bacterium]|nr:hypothetical protein [Phycisphaerales bacterium]
MNGHENDWLVDGVGEPDAMERGAEDALRGARWKADVDDLVARLERDSAGRTTAGAERAVRRKAWSRPAVLSAAGLAMVFGAWALLIRPGGSAWERAGGGAWRVGVWVETGSGTQEFAATSVGRVTVGPGSRVRLVAAENDEHRLELAQGSLEAFIYAPPRLFFVETPGATAVDMGCAYELEVAEDGSGLLRVTGGWVELEAKDGSGLVSRVPAGAVCEVRADGAPGLPRFEDAGEGFAAALAGWDSAPGALDLVLEQARARDGLTLWHLVPRTMGDDRAAVVDRLSELVPAVGPPDGVLTLDPAAMEAWWSAVRRSW